MPGSADTELADEIPNVFRWGYRKDRRPFSQGSRQWVGSSGTGLTRVQDVLVQLMPLRAWSVEVARENAVRINISVLIRFGAYAPRFRKDGKQAVSTQVTSMTGLEICRHQFAYWRCPDRRRVRADARSRKRRRTKDATKDAIKRQQRTLV